MRHQTTRPSSAGAAQSEADARASRLLTIELLLTVFASGAAVMTVEIVGTRVIAPVFGVGLFVWSALLSVTLCSLAVGYYVGGALADRRPDRRLLGVVVTVAGALLALTRPARYPILRAAEHLGPRLGPLISALLLFGPTLAALGTVGPIAVRLTTGTLAATGRKVGGVYSISTAGSLGGTLAVAFVLLPAFDMNDIVLGTACFLILLGALPLAIRGRRAAILVLLVPGAGVLVPQPPPPPGIAVLARTQSPYGLLEVIDDSNRGVLALRADHSIIGARWKVDRSSPFSFLHLLEAVRFMRPAGRAMLQIGLGVGTLPMVLEPHGITSDVVEIDPEVIRLARTYFGFATKGNVYAEDARTFLRRLGEQSYDIIVHDTFTGGATPEHLLSLEVIDRLHRLLRPGGLLALNFVGFQRGPHAEGTRAVMHTLQAVFKKVRAFRDLPPEEMPDSISNVIFFASDSGVDVTLPAGARFENATCEKLLRSLGEWEVLQDDKSGSPITDDHNPLARLQIAAAWEHFELMRQLMPVEVWLH